MTLGEKIRAARKAADLTQRELALALGEHDARLAETYDKTVGEWERDNTPRLPFYAVAAIARATRQPLSFFGEENEMLAVDLKVGELLAQGVPWEDIIDVFQAFADKISEERGEPPADAPRVPLQSAGEIARRHASRSARKAKGGQRRQGPQPPHSQDGDQP